MVENSISKKQERQDLNNISTGKNLTFLIVFNVYFYLYNI